MEYPAYYLNGDTNASYWPPQHVENSPEWFAPVVTTATIEIKAEMGFNTAWGVFCLACSDVGIKIPKLSPTEISDKEMIDSLTSKGYIIGHTENNSFSIYTDKQAIYTEKHHSAELEHCWNAARMRDPFDRAINQRLKFKDFADYMAVKLKQKQ